MRPKTSPVNEWDLQCELFKKEDRGTHHYDNKYSKSNLPHKATTTTTITTTKFYE